jgi:hypothetical protein
VYQVLEIIDFLPINWDFPMFVLIVMNFSIMSAAHLFITPLRLRNSVLNREKGEICHISFTFQLRVMKISTQRESCHSGLNSLSDCDMFTCQVHSVGVAIIAFFQQHLLPDTPISHFGQTHLVFSIMS